MALEKWLKVFHMGKVLVDLCKYFNLLKIRCFNSTTGGRFNFSMSWKWKTRDWNWRLMQHKIYEYQVMLILFNFRIESTCWTSYNMNVLVSIKSGKQLSMSANFGMFVSLVIKKIIVNEYQLRYVCFLWKWQ